MWMQIDIGDSERQAVRAAVAIRRMDLAILDDGAIGRVEHCRPCRLGTLWTCRVNLVGILVLKQVRRLDQIAMAARRRQKQADADPREPGVFSSYFHGSAHNLAIFLN